MSGITAFKNLPAKTGSTANFLFASSHIKIIKIASRGKNKAPTKDTNPKKLLNPVRYKAMGIKRTADRLIAGEKFKSYSKILLALSPTTI